MDYTAEIKRIVLEFADECAEINARYDRYFDQLPVNGAGETDALSLKYLNDWARQARVAAKTRYKAKVTETTLLHRIG